MTEQGILIAGGYGVVGQRIAADLGPDYEVIVAGRHLELAKATAAAIGHGVRSREIDVTVEASIKTALEGIATIVSSIGQPQRRMLHAGGSGCLSRSSIRPASSRISPGTD
jgi:saccharopine dehydrogenase-like NADP-dependent oxidoreductase